MELKEFFEQVGGDFGKVMLRFPTANMVKRFLLKFPGDPSFGELNTAWAADDIGTAFRMAHTLKGTAANLGLDALSEAASSLTEALRHTSTLPDAALLEAVAQEYEKAIALIARLG